MSILSVSCPNSADDWYNEYPTAEQINAIPVTSHYNIASMGATYPVVYFGLSVLEGTINKNHPTFYHLGRPGTVNQSALSGMGINAVPGVRQSWYYDDEEVAENLGRELYQRDRSAHITFYGEDVRAELGISFMYRQGIPEKNCTIIMLSDGAYSRNASILQYGNAADPVAQLAADRASVRNMIARAKIGIKPEPTEIGNMMLAFMLEMPNAYWWYNGASSLTTDVPALTDIVQPLLDSGRIVNKTTAALFHAVQMAGRIDDAKMLFNMANIAGTMDDNGKKTLIVIGTRTENEMNDASSVSANAGGATLPELFDTVIANYQGEYNIFYKGHPSTPTISGSEKGAYFAAHNIREIADASLPAEMLMYLIDAVYIGGYPGTTFQSSKDGQTLFFFSEPSKFFNWLSAGVNNPSYFLHGNTYFIYKEEGTVRRTLVQAGDIAR
jgi:hypothetical protein